MTLSFTTVDIDMYVTGLTLYIPNWLSFSLSLYIYTCVYAYHWSVGVCALSPLIEIEKVPVHSILGRTTQQYLTIRQPRKYTRT